MSRISRALRSFRLAPRTFLSRRRTPLSEEDRADIEALAAFYGAPGNPAWESAPRRLLILSYLPLPYVLKVEMLLARAMQRQGWAVSVLASASSSALAGAYHERVTGCEVLRLEDFLSFNRPADLRERVREGAALALRDPVAFKALHYRGMPLGLHALATLSSGRPDGSTTLTERDALLIGRLLRQSILLYEAADAMYAAQRPTLALTVEKGFISTCETFYAALERGVDFVQWMGCHEPEAIMLKRYRAATIREHPFSISDANWQKLRSAPWRDAYRESVLREFERGYKSGAWFRYKGLLSGTQTAGPGELRQRLGLDAGKKTAIIYSHILNDANLFYGSDLFTGGYEEWLVETVRAAAENPAVNWVLKVHPANRYRNANLGYAGEYGEVLALQRAFGKVPEFLRIVTPESAVSPLSFFEITDWGITVRGTVGLELPCFGVPVLTAGSGRYSGKGFTVDSGSTADYLARVRGIDHIAPLAEEQIRLAVLYAHHVFRSRPARYGEVMSDVYGKPQGDARYRDARLRAASADAALGHQQVQRMVDFLASNEDDFMDLSHA
jgi:hypothetical protein